MDNETLALLRKLQTEKDAHLIEPQEQTPARKLVKLGLARHWPQGNGLITLTNLGSDFNCTKTTNKSS